MIGKYLGPVLASALCVLSSPVAAQVFDQAELKAFEDRALGVCRKVEELSGSATFIEMQGEVDVEIRELLKLFADAEAGGGAAFRKEQFDNLSRDALAEALRRESDCSERVFLTLFEGMMRLLESERSRGPQLNVLRQKLALDDGSRVLDYVTAIPGRTGEYFLLAVFGDAGEERSAVIRIANDPGDDGRLSVDLHVTSDWPIHDIAWDFRFGLMMVSAGVGPDGDGIVQVITDVDGDLKTVYTSRFAGAVRNATLTVMDGRYVLAVGARQVEFLILDRAMRRVLGGSGLDLDEIGDAAGFSDGRLIVVGADHEGRGRDNGFAPAGHLRDVQGSSVALQFAFEQDFALVSPGRIGGLNHVSLSPSRQRAVVVGTTYAVGDPTLASANLKLAVLGPDAVVTFETDVPVRIANLRGKRHAASVVWRGDDVAFVHYVDAESAKRMVLQIPAGRFRIETDVAGVKAAAPASGCAPVGAAQAAANDMLLVEYCGANGSLFVTRILET